MFEISVEFGTDCDDSTPSVGSGDFDGDGFDACNPKILEIVMILSPILIHPLIVMKMVTMFVLNVMIQIVT